MAKERGRKVIAQNRKARHDFTIEDVYEAGMVLVGTEVKSLRAGRASLVDGYALFENGEIWLRGVSLMQGRTYYALVAAVDGAGHIGAVAVSSGQTYDGSPPVARAGDVTQVAQQEPNAAAAWNTRFASQAGFVVVQCPRCSDDTSGVTSGACALGGPGGVTVAARPLGSTWTNDAFVLGLQTPLADATPYSVTCECYNGANTDTAGRRALCQGDRDRHSQ